MLRFALKLIHFSELSQSGFPEIPRNRLETLSTCFGFRVLLISVRGATRVHGFPLLAIRDILISDSFFDILKQSRMYDTMAQKSESWSAAELSLAQVNWHDFGYGRYHDFNAMNSAWSNTIPEPRHFNTLWQKAGDSRYVVDALPLSPSNLTPLPDHQLPCAEIEFDMCDTCGI